jgi:hypothetical protein
LWGFDNCDDARIAVAAIAAVAAGATRAADPARATRHVGG